MRICLRLAFLFVTAVVIFTGCAQEDDGADDDSDSFRDDDDDDDDSDFCPEVVWEYIEVDAKAPGPNPETGDETPEQYNKVKFFRFRPDSGDEAPLEVSSILMLVPGFTVGASYLTFMAQRLVEMSCGDIEVWVLERRHHLLEDVSGAVEAQKQGDPMIAYDYYFGNREINGKTFDGYLNAHNEQTGFLSEWGMITALEDIRSVLHLVPEEKRRTTVFLAGHSRGGAYVKAYAAYEFEDGMIGADEIAGLALVDGDSRYNPWMTEDGYLRAIERIRTGRTARYITVPPFGPMIYNFCSILGMIASDQYADSSDSRIGPEGFLEDYSLLNLALPLLYRFRNISMTNEALLGFLTDKQTGPIYLLRAGFGALDGDVGKDLLGWSPTDENHIYRWKDFDEVSPIEYSNIQDFASTMIFGPSNTVDYYYAARLNYDFWAADILETEGTWREKYFTFRTSEMDAPVYVLGSRILTERKSRIDFYKNQLPPIRGGQASRDEEGFKTFYLPHWEHLDTVFAHESVNPFFPDFKNWIDKYSHDRVQIPYMEEVW